MIETTINIASIESASNRPNGGQGDLKILAEDMARNGLINPITVKANLLEVEKNGVSITHTVVAGRRRLEAAKLLKWTEIKARVLAGDETERADEITASENINRLAMHPLDEAILFAKILERGEPIQELAKRCDRAVSGIWQRIQLLELSEEIKAMFREGNLSLHTAAMLRSLDAEGQARFYAKFNDSYYIKNKDEIPDWEVKGFLNSIQHDCLYLFITDKACKGCKTRTFFTDKSLFPELDAANDTCLDHECYIKKWTKLLTNRIKSLKGEHPDTTVIAVESGPFSSFTKIFGKSVTIDGVEYNIKQMSWDTRADKAGKDTLSCFIVDMGSKLEIKPGYWKEPKKETAAKRESGFAPAVKFLGLPKEEAKQAIETLEESKTSSYELNNKVREKMFWRIMEERAKNPMDAEDIDRYLKKYGISDGYRDEPDGDGKRIYKLFTGKDYTGDLVAVKKLPWEGIFSLMLAMRLEPYQLPDIGDLTKEKNNFILEWAGIPLEKVSQMYQEEIRALLPKPKGTEKRDASAGKKKAAKR